ncbi:Atu4866 domain-containing protein [Kineococcus sp. TRM81007]|nr:Atu4866 domain-containing protein [Kineococcus sp. TRM81007]MCI2238482.1 Atu4866 domain-containing protein [Kineococcus sp. TRM81007]
MPAPGDAALSAHLGLWCTGGGHVRQELRPDGRYVEARGTHEAAYTGRYRITGDRIEYWDDSGFTADGTFVAGELLEGAVPGVGGGAQQGQRIGGAQRLTGRADDRASAETVSS